MDDSARRQRVIGLVTQFYYACRDGKDPYGPKVTAGLSTLVEGFNDYDLQRSVEVPQTPEAIQAVITDCVKDFVDQIGSQTMTAFVQMLGLFYELAQYAEQTSPLVNVPEFLRQAGLRAASGE
jgi:hypothetical protein